MTVVTADVNTDVQVWVEDEAERHPIVGEVVNLAREWGVRRHDELRGAIVERLPGWLADAGADRIVLFNDQSVRGSAIVAARGDVPVVLVQDGTLEFVERVTTPGLGDQNARYGTSDVARICVWGPRGRERVLAAREDLPQPDIRVTGAVLHSANPEARDCLRAPRPGAALR
ncbi:hypothetical protein [Demequina litorisediminis]|uniref:Uncharacterized protein n=1 Tax=Demequina litorisediminis TaxID=1849022 RepID=A0ABQ6IDB7_9MICO|nr:hypothetical protein [Demequina litorisediminis]GMA35847.1 hypothetical protein GCM10025876_20510 [Demequina litorisediminis]